MSDVSEDNTYQLIPILIGCLVIIAIIFIVFFGNKSNGDISRTDTEATSCRDVTSIDHNWNNDVLCTRTDGSTFYTNYSGGYSHDPSFKRR